MGSIEPALDPIWNRLSQARVGYGLNLFQPITSQVGRKCLGSDMGSIEPDLDPMWVRLRLARLGYGLNWLQPITIQVGCNRLGSDMGSIEPDLDPLWGPIESGTERIWNELATIHSSPGRMQTFWDPTCVRMSQLWVRDGSD